jgi:protein-tyrosine-phosphatase
MPEKTYNVLFLSQRNSARSVMAAALLNQIGRGKFKSFSAGVRPANEFDPVALELLRHAQISVPEGAPAHYREFAHENTPPLHFVFTLSDTAAGEPMPKWPGHPITAHWPCTDPERFAADTAGHRLALIRVRAELERRLRIFANLPFESLDHLVTQQHLDSLGRLVPEG